MQRGTWIIRNGELIPKHLAPPLHPTFAAAPGIIRDGMEPTLNHADGKRYDSKRAYEKAVRRAGCEIVGNETPRASAPAALPDPINDIREAVEKVSARTVTKRKRRGRI